MKRFIKTIATFLIAACFFMQHSHAQSVIDPNDPLVTYNPAAPPALPPGGQIGKWVRTVRVGWNSTAWKAYILNGVPFRVKFPTTYNHTAVDGKKYPAIVFFHGLGEKGPRTDNEFSMANGGPVFNSAVTSGKFDGFVIIPQSEGGWGTNHYAVVAQILDYMATNNKLDIFRVTTNGLSAGGNATWDMMINYPQHISQVLPMSGIAVGHRDPAKMAIFKYKPIWYFQGGLDGNPAPATADEVRFAIAGVGGNFKYTLYPNLGHGTWSTAWNETDFFPFCMRVYGSNPWTLFGRTEFCPGDPINVTVGVTPGYSAYEWSKNGEVIPGATGNSIQVNQVGIYAARMRKGTVWSEWSPVPVHIKIKAPTVTPPITVSGLMSKHLPALDTANVTLQVPEGYESYVWQKVGNNTTLSTDNTLNVNTTGDYIVRVTELYGCSSSFSAPFTVISADGPNKPSPATNLLASTLSKTSIRLDWSDNPTPQHNETGYEIYQGLQAGGPYKLIAITAANAISYTVNGLTPKTKYFFKLRGVNETAASAASNESTATTESDIQAPTAPSDLVLTSKSRTSLGLSWGPSTDDIGVVRYEIYLNGSKSYTTTNTSFTVYGLEYKKFYNIVVRAVDAAGNQSANSNQVTGQPVLTGLNYKYYTYTGNWSVLPNFNTLTPHTIGTMPNVSLSPRTQNDRFAFLWEGFITIPASGTYYFRTNSDDGSRLYLGPKDGTASPYDFSATPLVNNDGVHGSQDATSAAINLAAGTYPIAITFFENDGGEGMSVRWRTPSSGNNFVAIPDALFAEPVINPGSIPAKPTALSATVVSHKQINLSWKDNSDNETGFELYRSTSANSGFSVIAVVPANTESYSDSTLVPNTRYYYKLRAISTEGESALIYKFAEAQWKLDNNYTDASGNNRDLIPAGGPTFDGVSKAEGTHAVKQNGNTHQLSLNTNDGWLKNEYNEKSIAFWMKSSNNSGRLIVDIGGNDDGLAIGLNSNQIAAGVASNSNRRAIQVPYTSLDWNHIALVYNRNTLALYINGVLAGSINDLAFTSVGTTTNGSRISVTDGNNAFNSNANRFIGSLDNFTIFGSALTAEQVLEHMNNQNFVSEGKTLGQPATPPVPTDLVATATGTNSVNLNWAFQPTINSTTVIPAGTVRVEAESFFAQNGGVGTENSSEGTQNVRSIDPNDWMDYNVNVATGGSVTLNFRVATSSVATNHFEVRTSDEIVLATITIPKTNTNQTYTTVSTTVNLPAGPQTLRIHALRNGWNFNWFEIATGGSVIDNSSTIDAGSFQVYRSANNNANFVQIATIPGSSRSYIDSGLFANATYYYAVKAISLAGQGSISNEDSAKTWNNAPVIGNMVNRSVRYATTSNVAVTATDVDADQLNFTLENAPAFASIANNGTNGAVITLNPAVQDQGSFPGIRIIVTDTHGGADTTEFNLTVNDNYNPVISDITDYTVAENGNLNIALSATDQNAADVLSWSVANLPDNYTLTPGANGAASLQINPTFAGAGVYNVVVTVTDNNGGTAEKQFSLTVTDKDPNTRIYTRMKFANNIGAPWNSITGVNTSNLKDENNNTTSVGFNISPSWWLPYNAGPTTGNNSGVYPDAVLNDFWYFGYYGGPETANVTLTGLDPAKKYNLTFYAGSVFNGVQNNGTTNYSSGGKTVSLYVQNNTQNTVSINDLSPDANGNLTVNMSKGANTPIGYLNALVITTVYDDGTAPVAPKDLAAQAVSGQGVKLTWKDVPYNETGFEVVRATAPAGPYAAIGVADPNTTSYTDNTVSGATEYFYRLRAVNTYGNSPYTDSVAVTTVNRIPQLTPISDVQVKNTESKVINVVATDDAADHITLTAAGLPSFVSFVDNGNGTGTINVQPGAGDLGFYPGITITAKDNSDSSRSTSFSLFVVDADVSSTYVNITSDNMVAGKPWNNMVIPFIPYAGFSVNNLRDDSDINTGITVALTDAWQGVAATGVRSRNGRDLYPEQVTRRGIYFNDNGTRRVTVSGLNNSKKYNFVFINSHAVSESTLTNYTINGVTVSLNGSYNANKTVQINGITPVNGQVTINVTKGAGAVTALLSGLVIQSYTPATVPVVNPADLRVTDANTNSISLQWQDRADNETGYEIWRADDGGSYSLIATVDANTTSYVNNNLTTDRAYNYTVRAITATGSSNFSNATRGYTYNNLVYINFNSSNRPAPSPWNNLNWVYGIGASWSNFKNSAGLGTSFGMEQPVKVDGLVDLGVNTGNNSGIYPDNVLVENFGMFPGIATYVVIKGLNLSKTYDFTFFASVSGYIGDQTSSYTVNGKTVLLNAQNNRSGTVTMYGIKPDENGEVKVEFASYEGATFGLLGALIMKEYGESNNPVPQPAVAPQTRRANNTTVDNAVTKAEQKPEQVLAKTAPSQAVIEESQSGNSTISAYPNPFNGPFTLSVPATATDKIQVTMSDVSGKLVYQKRFDNLSSGTNIISVDTGKDLPSGIYLVRIAYTNGKEKTIKLVKR